MAIPPDKATGITPGQPITPGGIGGQPGARPGFESLMQGNAKGAQGPSAPSPGQIPQGPSMPQTPPTIDKVAAQATTLQDALGNVGDQLKTKDLKLTRSQQHLLRNKLSDASTHLRAANGKLGIETPPMPTPQGSGPIHKFLAFVGDGENQMKSVQQELANLKNKGEAINPADFMLIQVKMGQAQQEIEYASTLLSKVISSMTQIFTTQL